MRGVFFDAHGVLYTRVAWRPHLRAFLRAHGLPDPSPDALLAAVAAPRDQATRGAIPRRELYVAVLAACGVGDPALYDGGCRAQDADGATITLFDGVPETLRQLAARGFRLGVVTDSVHPTAAKLAWLRDRGLDLAWDAFADSCEVGARKPAAAMYETALRQCGLAARDAVFVGHRTSELRGARALGFLTVAYNADFDAVTDHAVARFADLLALPVLRAPA